MNPNTHQRRYASLGAALAMLIALLLGGVVTAPAASAATRTVCPVGCTYVTISSAVAAASANDRIEIGPGTYNETGILINKPLVVVGAGVGVTIINGGGGVVPLAGIFRIQTPAPSAGSGPIQLSDMTLTNPGRTSPTANFFTVSVANANATTGVTAIDVTNLDVQGQSVSGSSSYGIYGTGGVTAGVDRLIPPLTITGTTVSGQSQNGVLLEDWKAAVTVTGSTLAEGTSVASRSAFLAQSTQSAGRYTAAYTLTGNTFTGSSIWFSGFFNATTPPARGGFDTVTVTNNQFTGLTVNDVAISLGGTSGGFPAPAGQAAITKMGSVTVTGNTMLGDGSVGANTWGVRLTGAADQLTVEDNSIVGMRRAILVASDPSGSATAVGVARNRLFANVTGLENSSAAAVAATSNWWGCQAGPTSGAVACSPVINSSAGSVDTSTWIVATATLGATTLSTGGSTTVDASLTVLNTGASLVVPTAFAGLAVVRNTDVGSVTPATGTLTAGVSDTATLVAPATEGCGTVSVSIDSVTFATRTVTGEPVPLPFCVDVEPEITSGNPAAGATGLVYTHTVTATGTGPITFAVASGVLPSGLTLNPATGVISGTPTTAGSFTYSISATNNVGTDTAAYAQDIGTIPVITSGAPGNGQVSVGYSQTVSATGSGTVTYSIASGSLPPGLTLNPTTGVISGTPTTAGTYTYTVRASNTLGSDSEQYTQVVSSAAGGGTKPPAGLSSTGLDVTGAALVGSGALVAGLALLAISLRRRRQTAN